MALQLVYAFFAMHLDYDLVTWLDSRMVVS